ncbi:MAG: hypothetical protein AB8B97_19125 [Granulosicoccus sp.]
MKKQRIDEDSSPFFRSWFTRQRAILHACIALLLITPVVLGACSGSESQKAPETRVLIDDQVGSEPLPQVLRQLQSDENLLSPVPQVAFTQTMASTGLQISFTKESLIARAPPAVIEEQWVFMQGCLQQVSVAPLVLVREGPAAPFTSADDVVRNETITALEITSVPVASASTLYGPVVQVSVDDFDGSLGTPAFNLRSIMGRHLWLSAGLPERDYPFECARQQP